MSEEQITEQEQTFTTDTMELAVVREPGCLVRFAITVSENAMESGYMQAIKRVNKQISVPGFRKGHAPTAMVEKNFSSQIKSEWEDIVLNKAFQEALTLSGERPFTRKSIHPPKIDSFARGQPSVFSLTFEASPSVPRIDPSVLQVEKVEPKQVTDKQEEQALDNLLHEHAKWEKVEDRSIEEGDYIDVDLFCLDEPAHVLAKNTRMWVKKGVMPQWMHSLVLGKSKDDTVEGTSQKDETMTREETEGAFQPMLCKIAILQVWKAELSSLDNEFAKKFGLETVEELREKIKQSLRNNAEAEAHQKMIVQLEKALLRTYLFDLPRSLIERETTQRVSGENARLRQLEYSKEAIQQRQQETQKKAWQLADEELRLAFLFRAIAEEQNIPITKDELLAELNRQLWVLPPEERVVNNSMGSEEMRQNLEVIILNRKAKEFLLARVLT